jgi:hypothetical protein
MADHIPVNFIIKNFVFAALGVADQIIFYGLENSQLKIPRVVIKSDSNPENIPGMSNILDKVQTPTLFFVVQTSPAVQMQITVLCQ